MKKTALYSYIILFFIISMLPSVFLVFGFESPNFEKRILAPETKVMVEGQPNLLFAQEYDAYFNDHFAFKPYFVSAYAYLTKMVFHTSVNQDVIVGRDGFLFYKETLYDYWGISDQSDAYLEQVCAQLKEKQDALEAEGIKFIFMICPNKNTIYPEYMPKRFRKLQLSSTASRLYEMMDDYGIHCVDVTRELLDEKDGALLWQKEDTHWNKLGSLVAYTALMDMMIEQMPGMTFRDFSDTTYRYEKRDAGDLAQMLYATDRIKEPTVVFNYEPEFRYLTGDPDSDIIKTLTVNETADKRALVMCDSFFTALTEFFSENFNYAEFLHIDTFDFDYVLEQNVDIVVVETVERNLFLLLDYLTQ